MGRLMPVFEIGQRVRFHRFPGKRQPDNHPAIGAVGTVVGVVKRTSEAWNWQEYVVRWDNGDTSQWPSGHLDRALRERRKVAAHE